MIFMKNKKTIFIIALNVFYLFSIIVLFYYISNLLLQNGELKNQVINQKEETNKFKETTDSLRNKMKKYGNTFDVDYKIRDLEQKDDDLEERIENLERDSHYHY